MVNSLIDPIPVLICYVLIPSYVIVISVRKIVVCGAEPAS